MTMVLERVCLLTRNQDDDHQSKYVPPTSSQEIAAMAKHTWEDWSVASLKEGLGTVASIAAKEASARLPNVVTGYATTAGSYVSQAVRGSPRRASSPQQIGRFQQAGGSGHTDWEPPVNSFTLAENTKGRVHDPEHVVANQQKRLHTRPYSRSSFEEDQVDYDPLGHSNQWKRAHRLDEYTRERKARLRDDWEKKVEKESDPKRGHR